MLLFVDKSAFIALNSPVSPNHTDAVEFVRGMVDQTIRVATSRQTVIATADHLKAKVGAQVATRFLELIEQGDIKVLPTNAEIYEKAEKLFLESAEERDIGYSDCVNAAIMHHFGVTKLFTFNTQLSVLNVIPVPKE